MKFTEQSLAFISFDGLLGKIRNKNVPISDDDDNANEQGATSDVFRRKGAEAPFSACVVALSRSMMRLVFTEQCLAFLYSSRTLFNQVSLT